MSSSTPKRFNKKNTAAAPPASVVTEIRIHYPPGHNYTVGMRCSKDSWATFHYATKSHDTEWIYKVSSQPDGPMLEFKPVLLEHIRSSGSATSSSNPDDDDVEIYAVGGNYVAKPGESMDIYPWFFSMHGSIQSLDVHSNILNDDREVLVYLPPSYNENFSKQYPVLIMHDGHNLFYEEKSYCGRTWKILDTMDELCTSGIIKEAIVVGIFPKRRFFEYLPRVPEKCFPNHRKLKQSPGGGADKYLDFIGKELRKSLVSRYRTLPDFSILGSSYGGIISLYAWLTRPGEYTKCGCYSASLRWHEKEMFRIAENVLGQMSRTHQDGHEVYFDAGTENDQVYVTAKMAELVEKALSSSGPKDVPAPLAKREDEKKRSAYEIVHDLARACGTSTPIKKDAGGSSVSTVLSSGRVMVNIGQGHYHCEDAWAERTPHAIAYLLRDGQREMRWVDDVLARITSRIVQEQRYEREMRIKPAVVPDVRKYSLMATPILALPSFQQQQQKKNVKDETFLHEQPGMIAVGAQM
eukprot:TRINITY_DN4656_c0_g1_i2.p1 TRINITY_DN4656_c0_g1~~TRINITY_DN4656_c0_g1_i2.p1  ORF type:complete len:545 (-),score=136.02 TRINITY_DN4656_c0_g1_i2:65-1633(-)